MLYTAVASYWCTSSFSFIGILPAQGTKHELAFSDSPSSAYCLRKELSTNLRFLIVFPVVQSLVKAIVAQQQQLAAVYIPRIHFKTQALSAVRYWRGISTSVALKELCVFIKLLFDTTQVLSKSDNSSYSAFGSECFLRTHGYFVSVVQAHAQDDKSSDKPWCIDVGIVCDWPSGNTSYDYMHTTAVKPDQYDVMRWMRQIAYAVRLYEDIKPIRTTASSHYNSICSHNIVLSQQGAQLILHTDNNDADNSELAQITAAPLSSQLDAKLNLCLPCTSSMCSCNCSESNKGPVTVVQALSNIFHELAVATASHTTALATASILQHSSSNTAYLPHLLRTVPIHSDYKLGDCVRRILSLTATTDKTHTASKAVSVADVCSILDEYAIKLELGQRIAQALQHLQQQHQSLITHNNQNDAQNLIETVKTESEKHRAIIAGLKRAHARVVAYNMKLAYDRLSPEQKLHNAKVKQAQKQSLLNAKYRRKCISAASLRHWASEQIGLWLYELLSKLTVNSKLVAATATANAKANKTVQDENTSVINDTDTTDTIVTKNASTTLTRSESSDSTVQKLAQNKQLNSDTAVHISKLQHSNYSATSGGIASGCNSYSVNAQRLCTDMQVSVNLLLLALMFKFVQCMHA
jgi:hypothetical protein